MSYRHTRLGQRSETIRKDAIPPIEVTAAIDVTIFGERREAKAVASTPWIDAGVATVPTNVNPGPAKAIGGHGVIPPSRNVRATTADNLNTKVSSLPSTGRVAVLLENGSYGNRTISVARSGGMCRLKAINHLAADFGSVTFSQAAYVGVEGIDSTSTISIPDNIDESHHIDVIGCRAKGVIIHGADPPASTSPHHWRIYRNSLQNTSTYPIGLFLNDITLRGPTDIFVFNNQLGPLAGAQDAIRLTGWKRVAIIDNEIEGVIEDGQHNDGLQSVHGGEYLIYHRNYLHDNRCQTFFLKDGYCEYVEFTDNLSVRNRDPAGTASVHGKIYPTNTWTMKNNTLWDSSPFGYRAAESGSAYWPGGPAVNYDTQYNVLNNHYHDAGLSVSGYKIEAHNVYGFVQGFTPSGTSEIDTSPNFVNTAVDDYRLDDDSGRGVTWSPADRLFGTAAYLAYGGG